MDDSAGRCRSRKSWFEFVNDDMKKDWFNKRDKVKRLKWSLTAADSLPFKGNIRHGSRIFLGLLSLQPVLGIESGPPKWFANAFSARPWRRAMEMAP